MPRDDDLLYDNADEALSEALQRHRPRTLLVFGEPTAEDVSRLEAAVASGLPVVARRCRPPLHGLPAGVFAIARSGSWNLLVVPDSNRTGSRVSGRLDRLEDSHFLAQAEHWQRATWSSASPVGRAYARYRFLRPAGRHQPLRTDRGLHTDR